MTGDGAWGFRRFSNAGLTILPDRRFGKWPQQGTRQDEVWQRVTRRLLKQQTGIEVKLRPFAYDI
eukprot:4612152-Heterocapsa_arctica.AAC.1